MEITEEIKRRRQHLQYKNEQGTNIDKGERLLSVTGGVFLLAKGVSGMVKHPFLGLQGVALGAFLVYRGATGNCPVYRKIGKDTSDPQAININERITVQAPREKVYAFWRELSNLPKFMSHISSVVETGPQHSSWVASTPGKLLELKWNAEITHEEEGKYIGWQSVEGSMIDNAGKIEFRDSLNGTATDLQIQISYFPPAGSIGRGIASLFTGLFEKSIREDIINFQTYAEAADFRSFAGLSGE